MAARTPLIVGASVRRFLAGLTSVDNTVPRFDGLLGALQASGVVISDEDQITSSKFVTHSVSLADDTATLFDGTAGIQARGLLLISGNDVSTSALLYVNTPAAIVQEMGTTAGSYIDLTTGVLSGTTGSDVKVTVSTHTDGNIYLENRMGTTVGFGIVYTGR